MTFEFKLPDIGEGVHEGEIVAWHVTPGQAVKENDPMIEVMTDKVTVTIGAPKTGTIVECRGGVGEKIAVGNVIVVIELGANASVPPARLSTQPAPENKEAVATAVGDIRNTLPGADVFAASNVKPLPLSKAEHVLASPATRKLARDHGLDIRTLRGTGEGGRVLRDDVLRATGQSTVDQNEPTVHRMPSRPPQLQLISAEGPREERKPFVGLRRKIAERMQMAKRTAAHFTFVESCDVGALISLRNRLQPRPEFQRIKLTFLPFIVKAVSQALKKYPVVNSYLDEARNELVYRYDYHIGIATATEQGLMVPVLTHADKRTLSDLAYEVERLSQGARQQKLNVAELSGSTFTVTSLGKLGGMLATPVLNMPEVGIMGIHRIKEQPVVKGGQIVVGQVMTTSFTFDHRIVDGHIGAAFAYEVLGLLEEPTLLFAEGQL